MDRKKENPAKKKTTRAARKKPEKTVKRSVISRAEKKIEVELAQVDEKLHKMTYILEHLSQGVCLFNKEDAVRYCNESFSTVTGLSIDTIKGKKLRKNQVWGARGEEDHLKEMFQQARGSVTPVHVKALPVNAGERGERLWDITLSPQKDENGDYNGMALVIEDVTGKKAAPEDSLFNAIYAAAMQHTETQPLLDSVVTIFKDYTACSSVKIVVLDRVRDRVFKADSDRQAGLWDTDRPLSPAEVDSMFKDDVGEVQQSRTGGGSIVIRDLQKSKNDLTGILKDIVVRLSDSYGFAAIAFIPIRFEGWIHGFVQLARTGGDIQADTVSMIENISNQLQVLLEHSGFKEEMRMQREALLKQMNERNAHLEAMSEHLKQEMAERKKAQEEMRVQRDLALALNEMDDLEEALKLCLDTAIRASAMDCGGIYVIDDVAGDISLVCVRGVSEDFIRQAGHYDKDFVNAEVVARGKSVYLHASETGAVYQAALNTEGIKSVGIVPVVHENRPIAVLNIASHTAEEIPFNARNALEAIAAQTGAVLTSIRHQQAFIESQIRYKALFEQTANPILMIDPDGNYVDGNDAALAFMECSHDELLHMNVKDTLPPYLDAEWLDKYRQFWQKGGTIERDYYVWGKIKVMELTITPLQLGDRRVIISIGTDITEKKRVENELKKSEEKFRRHFENVYDVVFSVDTEGKIQDISPSIEKILGYTQQELIGMSVLEADFIAPQSLEKAAVNIGRILNGENVEPSVFILKTKSGNTKYVDVSASPLVEDGKVTGLICVSRDITDRINVENELRESEEKFRRLFFESPVGAAMTSLEDYHFISVNEALCRSTGYSAEELTRMTIKDVAHPDQVEDELASIGKLVRGEIDHLERDGRFIKKVGTYSWMHVSVRLIRDTEGNPLYLFPILEDINARKQAEDALQRSESMFKNIVEHISDVFYVQDKDGKLTYISPQVESILGYTAGEMVDGWEKHLSASPLNAEGLARTTKAMETGEKQEPYLMEFISRSGRPLIAEINESPIKDAWGNITGTVGVARDVTEQIRAEDILKASEEKFKNIVEASPDPVWEVNAEGILTYVSPQMTEVLGYAPGDILGKAQFSLVRPYQVDALKDKFKEAQQPGKSLYTMRINVATSDGRELIMEVRAAQVLDNRGNFRGFRGISRDITEQVKFEKTLQESEEKYRSVVENSDQGIFVVQDGVFKFANDRLINFSKYSRDELSQLNGSEPLKALVHPDDLQKVEQIYYCRLRGEEAPDHYEFRWLDKDGEVKWADINITQFKWEGKPASLGFVTDITERKRMQKALSESEEKYRTVLNEMQEYYYEMDPAGNFTFISEAAGPIFGYSIEELTGMNYKVYVPPEARKNMLEASSEVFRTGRRNYGIQVEHIRKDGTRFVVETSLLPVRNENGDIVGLRGVGRDITERMKAEEELQKRSLLLDSAYDSIIAYGLDGLIIYANEAACSSRGYTRDEMLQMSVRQLVPENGLTTLEERLQAIKEKGELIFEATHVNGDSSLFQVEAYSRLIKVAGKEIVVAVYRDITQRRLAEQALRDSEARFRDLADMLPLIIVEADCDGKLTYINNRATGVLGYASSELIGNSIFDILDSTSLEIARYGMPQVLQGINLGAQEYLFVKKDGSKFDGIVYSSRIMQGEEVKGARGVIVDISDIREAEKELRDSEGKYRLVVENANEAIYIVQGDRLVYFNNRTMELTGYDSEELLSRPFADYLHPGDRDVVVRNYLARMKGEKLPDYYTFRIINKKGEVRCMGLRATPIQWEGKPATLNFAMDVTEYMEAESAARESQERYRLLADNSMDVIWTADMDLKMNYVSPSIRYMLGLSAEDIMAMYHEGKLKAEILGMSEADGKRVLGALKALQQDPSRTQVLEFEFKHRDGFTNWAEAKMSVMRDKSGQPAGMLGIVRDITQQKKMTERLIRSDRLAALGEMAAGLAHEVNNPLTAVMGFAYLVLQNPNLTPDIKNDINSIYNEGKRAADVIKNFLIFARGHKPEKQAIFINDVIESTLKLRHSQMCGENITVMVNLAEDLPAVNGDVSQLQQVFLNILLNAEHFMYQVNKKGTLSITTLQEGDSIKIYIKDDGPGIAPEKLSRVFDPFYTTKQVGEGTGLGLSICHGIVTEHGGAIYVESREGDGATFIIELPYGK